MTHIRVLRNAAVAAATAVLIVLLTPGASAQGVVSGWNEVKAPPAPELKTVQVDPQKTALLVMDFNEALCSSGGAVPRCAEAIPKVKELLEKARAHHMLVVFTGYPHMKPIVKALARMHDEPMVVGHANKFEGTDLNKMLKDHGITTVITTGVVGNGAVLFTAFGAAGNGYKVIVPVDTMPGPSPYAEQSSIWGVMNDPGLGNATTVTSVGKISF
jgi:nicotinamidase-related amidase